MMDARILHVGDVVELRCGGVWWAAVDPAADALFTVHRLQATG
jgi:hypothetical protein